MIQLNLNNLLFLDLEINPKNQHIFKVGALLIKNFGTENVSRQTLELETKSKHSLREALREISQLAKHADYLVGHNIIEHDLLILKSIDSTLDFLRLPIIDTLQLSPLAFPKNPYHRLLKDYKLIRSALNSPLQDCEATYTLLQEQLLAFQDFAISNLDELRCYQTILAKENPTYAEIIEQITQLPSFTKEEFAVILPEIVRNHNPNVDITYKVCTTELNKLIEHDVLFEPDIAFPFLYTLSWLRVSGDNSVLAPWVRHQFPETSNLIAMLREKSCEQDNCSYCSTIHNPRKELQRYFGFDDFRYEDINANESIQRDIVEIGMRDENIFAILPTGGGKSLCYQLPALNRFFRNGSLTIIISPLQALMKDQVDGLIAKHIHGVAALNGMLSLPERADVLEKIQMGDVGLLLVSPEQFRSTRFKRAIAHRQIGAWIYDEAHCLSKWGNDFRPDYLYVAKCIQDFSKSQPLPPIGCFTATAKQEVIEDIKQHFQELLSIEFTDKISLKERTNLSFDIIECTQHEKISTINQLLTEFVLDEGGAIIFVSRRKAAEEIAKQLQAHHWNCHHFHGGLPANEKKDIQNSFIEGETKIIVSTNAFGMGVDKEDVRLVIHADIPGSLENYLQEAGRAGRDQSEAKCILLYDPNDIEIQFRLTEFSKVLRPDISAIYKKLRAEQSKRKNTDLVISIGEILKDSLVESFDIDDDHTRTKVITAIAWLEKSGYLERTDNVVRIFPSHLKMNLEDALAKIQTENLGERKKQEFSTIVEYIHKHPSNQIIDTDHLVELISASQDEVADILTELQKLEILTNNTLLTAYVRHGISDTTRKRLDFSLWCENTLFDLLSEFSPDVDSGEWRSLDLAILCNHLNQEFNDPELKKSLKKYLINGKIQPSFISKLFKVICEDKTSNSESAQKNLLSHTKIIEIKSDRKRDSILLKVNGHHTWQEIKDNGDVRRIVGQKIVELLLAKVSGSGKDLLVETTFETLQNAVFSDLVLAEQFPDITQQRKVIENALLYLHNLEMLSLNHGMTVMKNSLTIKVDLERHNRYLKNDYTLLEDHYKERRLQIHVMREYATIGLKALDEAMRFVLDYFSLIESIFIKKYFKGREEILTLATSEESWRNIVENLNPIQRQIVESKDNNRLILAGPGSGKTRVIVHRIAYLLRVQRVPAHSIIALAYNRSAANEIRKRLYDLVGKESYGVTVMTYHSIAMRLTGNTYQQNQSDSSEIELQDQFKKMLRDAIDMLRGQDTELNLQEDDENDSRARLLQGYRYILVDEYQDIDEDQYDLISALAGRNTEDDDEKLTILAVGDDDQNIYTFRGSSNQYIDRFTEDYQATIDYLVENYRSTKGIIQASNDVIEHNSQRLKSDYPITIDQNRQKEPQYGRWESLDEKRGGKILVRILEHPEYTAQAFIVINELKRLITIDPNVINSCAILSRSKKALDYFAGGLKELNYPHYYEHDKSSYFSTPSNRYFQKCIRDIQALTEDDSVQSIQSLINWNDYPERWQYYFSEAFSQAELVFDKFSININNFVQWLYDYAYEMPITVKQGIFLGTMHSAKGLEFDHVFILDHLGDDCPHLDNDEERRLYYVGMTRAKETLMLCSFNKKHSIIQSINNTLDSRVSNTGSALALQQRHILLSPKDVYMDYLGAQSNKESQNASIDLTENSPLIVEKSSDNRLIFKDKLTGQTVAKSSKNFKYNSINLEDLECYVYSITQRNISMINDESYKQRCRCDNWETIQPKMIIKM